MKYVPLNADLSLDPKGRLMLPRELRLDLDRAGVNRLVAFANQGAKGGLCFMLPEDYEQKLASHYLGDNPLDPTARLFAEVIAATAQTVKIDGNGRVLLPARLRMLAGLDKEVYLFTSGSWFEVWDAERFFDRQFAASADLWSKVYGQGRLLGGARSGSTGTGPDAGPQPAGDE